MLKKAESTGLKYVILNCCRYLAGRTPEHIKKKVIEMLFVWTQRSDLKGETKISEAYTMLKSQVSKTY